MASLQNIVVSLRFQGDHLDPDEISRSLGTDATWAYRKGATQLSPRGRQVITQTGIWLLTVVNPSPIGLDEEVARMFSGLTSNLDHWNSIARHFEGSLFCGLSVPDCNEGVRFLPTTLKAVGERGLVLDLDIYCENDDMDEGILQPPRQRWLLG
ncbi:DUF4279 domain-containing protein [Agrobacterium rhizogenes]|uniref:DUF4279 domain-containing protein n=1 Tax=Rhizobium rhizogenes TaxID=359 RepID=UPI0015717F50|nr:DUF4279 domain-containing protein [Rhizobium rhizogenes]NTF91085.1 DUF4279 domain-containing protein [Rhizobium rhizogenes]